jgi:hypothetical protein
MATVSLIIVPTKIFGTMLKFTKLARGFSAVRRAAAAAVDVKAEFALRIFMAEINFAGRTVHPSVTSMN